MVSPDPLRAVGRTIASALEWGAAQLGAVSASPRLDAELLLASATGATRSALAAWPEREVDAQCSGLYRQLVQRRAGGEPVAYLLGRREFWSLDLEVSPATLIPRPDTERLVARALELLPREAPLPVLDLGTGSGAIALALAVERPHATIVAVERSAAALTVARRNAGRLGLAVTFLQSDWFSAVAGRRFALIVSNPPYVRRDDPHLSRGEARFEPRAARDGGVDGLAALTRIVAAAPDHLEPDGTLLLEHGFDQGSAVLGLLTQRGFTACRDHTDLGGQPRVAEARWPATASRSHQPEDDS